MAGSVTRLATFHQFGKKLKVFGQFVWIAYLVFGKLLYQLWHFYATGQIFIVVNGHRLNSNIANLVTLLAAPPLLSDLFLE